MTFLKEFFKTGASTRKIKTWNLKQQKKHKIEWAEYLDFQEKKIKKNIAWFCGLFQTTVIKILEEKLYGRSIFSFIFNTPISESRELVILISVCIQKEMSYIR